jgi:hypothetical protein
MPRIASYGTWTSPITSDIIAAGSTNLKEVHTNASRPWPNPTPGEHLEGEIFLIEGRPSENGRTTILQVSTEGGRTELLPKEFSAAGKIHEYGGGAAFVPVGDSKNIIFNDGRTDGVFCLSLPEKNLTSYLEPDKRFRYADFHAEVGTGILAIREEHFEDGTEVKNEIAIIDPTPGNQKARAVVTGADFYSHPRFSPDGKRVCWMQWNHPDMPWTGSELYVSDWKDGEILEGTLIAGKAREQAICQPRWAWDGSLWFVNDPKGTWALFRWDPATGEVEEIILDGYQDAEVGAREIQMSK